MTLDVGLVGAGGMGGVHLAAWVALGARVRVFSDDGRAPARAAGYAAHGVTAVDSLDELLAGSAVVDVCTPTYTHKAIGLAAVAAGRHVVCEKPLALTVADAAELVAAARDAGVQLFPAHVVRFFPEYQAMARAVAAGAVGTPAVLRFTRTGASPAWSSWFTDPALSGGILVDQMIHDFDFARLLAGEVVRVYAQHRDGAGNVAAGTAVLTHAGGAVSHVHGVWGLPGSPFRTSYRIAGPDGVLQHDSGQTEAFRIVVQRAAPAGEGIPNTSLTESPYLTELREFAAALTGGPPPRVSAEDGLAAVRIAVAAQESAATGRAVEIEHEGAVR
jgi:predicted dehydrogenase